MSDSMASLARRGDVALASGTPRDVAVTGRVAGILARCDSFADTCRQGSAPYVASFSKRACVEYKMRTSRRSRLEKTRDHVIRPHSKIQSLDDT